MSYNYENAFDKVCKELRRLRIIIREQEQEIEDLRSIMESGDYFDKTNAVNLEEIAHNREDWEFFDSEDYGYDGTEIYKNNKTNKYYMIEWTRVRHYDKAVEIDAETGRVKV
tara:strand:+ start:70 stop:405 length:336 start_codon:yes stop_codon:yes gene_type:complete